MTLVARWPALAGGGPSTRQSGWPAGGAPATDSTTPVGVVSSAGACREAADLIVAYATGAISYRKARRRLLFQFPRVAFRLARVAVSA